MAVTNNPLAAAVAAAAQRQRPTVTRDGRELPAPIDGVMLERSPIHSDPRGALIPFFDTASPIWSEPLVYSYCITIRPGRIKGWGMHERQTDRYFVLRGHLRVALFDGRDDSPTSGAQHEVHFTPETPGVISIPAGVWHADQNWGRSDAVVINFPTRVYDPDDPDKHRIDPHAGVIPFDWSIRDG